MSAAIAPRPVLRHDETATVPGRRRVPQRLLVSAVVVGVVVGLAAAPAGPAIRSSFAWLTAPRSPASASIPGGASPGGSAGGCPCGGAVGAEPSPSAQPLARPDPATSTALAAAVANARWRYGIPGVSVAIAYADGTVWMGHAGVSDVRTRTPVRTETAFAFGSVTKTFTAALILKLVEEGALSLDDRVLRWLPEYADRSFLGTTPARRSIMTVRMLLAQTSGLYDYFNSLSLDARLRAAKKRAWTPDQVLAYVKKPLFIAGDGWSYANTNYLLLGLIAERAGGAPVAQLLRSRIFDPLGLRSLYVQAAEPVRGTVSRGYDFASLSRTATPIPWSDGTRAMPFTSVVTAAGSAGAVAGCARDLARWGLALYTGSLLRPDSLSEMLAFDGTAAPGAAVDYGLGVGRRLIGDRMTYGHSGRLAGYRSSVRYVPSLGVAVAVLTNQDRWDPDRVVEALLDVIDPPPPPTPSPTPLPSPTWPPGPEPSPTPDVSPSIGP